MTVEVVRAGGKVVFTTTAARGAKLTVDARAWPDGPYEVRCTHAAAFDRSSLRDPPALVQGRQPRQGARAGRRRPRPPTPRSPRASPSGCSSTWSRTAWAASSSEAKGNPWRKIHSPLMEYDELMLERQGQTGRIRPYGFVRLAYRDDVDGSPQFCRAYLPPGYEPGKKWPLVVQLHGYNPANPVYVRWWGAADRHPGIDTEFSNHQGVIYLEPHGRGNTQYLGMGDSDVLRAIAEAKRLFSVDEDRVYLTGDSMGGWGTWNVATRHPDLFAAIAPVFGGVDYHSTMSEEELAQAQPVERFLQREAELLGAWPTGS